MPYNSNSDLPAAIKSALPDAAQTIWRKAHDAALGTYDGDESKASATAWTAVKAKYRKADDGSWVAKGLGSRLAERMGLSKELSLDAQSGEVREAWRDQYGSSPGMYTYVTESYADHAIVCVGDDEHYSVPYTGGPDADSITFDVQSAVEVERDWVPVQKMFDVPISKVDDEQRVVFGWANLPFSSDGRQIVDLQDDVIEVDDLEKAAYDFVLESRQSDVVHDEQAVGTLVESLIFTPDKLAKMGLPQGAVPQGAWWIGFKVRDDAAWAGVKDGTYKMFSIGGSGVRTPAGAEA